MTISLFHPFVCLLEGLRLDGLKMETLQSNMFCIEKKTILYTLLLWDCHMRSPSYSMQNV